MGWEDFFNFRTLKKTPWPRKLLKDKVVSVHIIRKYILKHLDVSSKIIILTRGAHSPANAH